MPSAGTRARCDSDTPSPCSTAASVQPPYGALHNPSLWQHDELAGIASPDDFEVYLPADPVKTLLEFRPLIAAVGIELQQERIHSEQGRHHQHAAVPVLHVGRMDQRVQQQSLRVYPVSYTHLRAH